MIFVSATDSDLSFTCGPLFVGRAGYIVYPQRIRRSKEVHDDEGIFP
jgi:hypothetical protein